MRVVGKIGKGIVKVFVNNFELTKYVPDSEEWVYYAKVAYDNLKEGENQYAVYGVDADGKFTEDNKVVKVVLSDSDKSTIVEIIEGLIK